MGAVLAPAEAPPLAYADLEAAWKSNPYITYNELAAMFDVSVTEVMAVIDSHISQNPAPADPG